MCDDFYDDFDSDFDGEAEDWGDNGLYEGDIEDIGAPDGEDPTPESDDAFWDGLGWQDWMIIGPLSEEIAREKRVRERMRRENEDENDYWDIIERKL